MKVLRQLKNWLKTRLFISTYNATTFNESLAANIPTVIFWDENIWESAEWTISDFNMLKSVGIFHETPLGIAACNSSLG